MRSVCISPVQYYSANPTVLGRGTFIDETPFAI